MMLWQSSLLKRFLLTSTSLICLSSALEASSFREAELPSKRESTRPRGVRLGQKREPGLFEIQAAFKKNLLTSIQAREDQLTPLLQALRPLLKDLPPESQRIIEDKFEGLLQEQWSLLPHTLLDSTHLVATIAHLEPNHFIFNHFNKMMESLRVLSEDPTLKEVASLLKQLQAYYLKYQEQLCQMLPHERLSLLSALALKGDCLENPVIISQEMTYRLLSTDKYGITTKQNKDGSSPNVKIGPIYFKTAIFRECPPEPRTLVEEDPSSSPSLRQRLFKKPLQQEQTVKKKTLLDPGMEWAMWAFHTALFGEGIAPSAFLVFPQVPHYQPALGDLGKEARQLIEGINSPSMSAPDRDKACRRLYQDESLKKQLIDATAPFAAQASYGIEGIALKTFLEQAQDNPSLFESLDKGQVQKLLISLLLTNPNDAKGDNFIVTNGNENRKIISIDNDLSFAARIIAGGEGKIHFPEVRNLLFMIPEFMEQPVLPEVRTHFLSQEPTLFLLQWLRALEEQNRRYQALEADLGADIFALFRLPFQLQHGTVKRLHQEITKLQQTLHVNSDLSLQKVLETFSPLLGIYYQKLRDKDTDYLAMFERLYRGHQQTQFEELLDVEHVLPNGVSIKEALDAEQAQEEGFKHRTQPIKEAVTELFEVFDPIGLKPAALKAVLEAVRLSFPEVLESVLLKTPLFNLLSANLSKELLDTFFMFFPERLHEIEEGTSFSPLHHALEMNNTKLIAYLLNKGAFPNQRTKDHRFPLDLACEKESQEAFKLLVDAGASKVNADKALTFYHKLGSNADGVKAVIKLARRHQELHWLLSIRTLLPEKGEGVPVQTASFGNRILPQSLYDELFTVKGTIKAENISGRHAVGRLSVALLNLPLTLYFKAYPELPGLEEAVGEFTRRLLGFGAPYAELIKVGSSPVLVSQGIQGPTLAHILKEAPQTLNHLDADALSSLYLATMLVNPEDGKADNYMVETMATGHVRLIAIDNDHAFVPAVARQQKKSFLKAEPVVQVKSILYCLDAFQAPVSAVAREQLLSVNAGKMLEEWLRLLRARNSLYSELFDDKERLSLLKQDSYIGIPFQEGAITHLYQKIKRMQEVLEQDPTLTHERLLKLLEPELAHRYGKGFEKPATVLERFQVIDGPFYGKGSTGEPYTFTKSGHILKALNIPLKESLIQVASRDSVQTHDYRPNKALQELKDILGQHQQSAFSKIGSLNAQQLKSLPAQDLMQALSQQDFAKVSLADQRVLFESLKGRKVEELILKNATALTSKMVLTYPQLDGLMSINLSGCVNLTDKIIEPLAKSALHLKYLNLSNLPKLQKFGKIAWLNSDSVIFPSLQILLLNKSGIRSIYLRGFSLKILEAQNCAKLQYLKVKGNQLEELILNNSSINIEDLIKVLQSHQLKLLEIEGVIQQSDTEAQFNLGEMYADGWLVQKDDLKALQYYHKAAADGHVKAQYRLGEIYRLGRGTQVDESLAVSWYQKAINQDDNDARYALAQMYEEGKSIARDQDKALKLYNVAAQKGYRDAWFNLTLKNYTFTAIEIDEIWGMSVSGLWSVSIGREQVEWFLNRLSKSDDSDPLSPYCLCTVAQLFHYGRGIGIDEVKAYEYFKEIINNYKGHSCLSLTHLAHGIAYYHLEKFDKVNYCFESAITIACNESALLPAYVWQAHILKQGLCKFERDLDDVFRILEKAARYNYAPAFYNLALMYRDGEGVSQDDTKAISLLQKAVDLQDGEAQYTLGWMYQEGRGVTKNFQKAHQLFKEGEKRYAHDALYSLGRMYEYGLSVKKDSKKAHYYYKKASDLNNILAKRRLWMGIH